MVRSKERVLESIRYFKIIFNVAQGNNYNEVLAKKLKIKPSSVIEHLQFLEKEKFLFSEREKKHNRKNYSVNYEKLASYFMETIIEHKMKKTYEIMNASVGLNNTEKLQLLFEDIKKELHNLKGNKGLINFFKEIFEDEKEGKKIITILQKKFHPRPLVFSIIFELMYIVYIKMWEKNKFVGGKEDYKVSSAIRRINDFIFELAKNSQSHLDENVNSAIGDLKQMKKQNKR